MGRRQKISDDQLRAAARAGMSPRATARRYGVSETTISRRSDQAGIAFPAAKMGPAPINDDLTADQRSDIELLVTKAGYTKRAARDLVLRPKVKVRAVPPQPVPPPVEAQLLPPRPRFSVAPAVIERHLGAQA